MADPSPRPVCPECRGSDLWTTKVPAGGYGISLLPGLGDFLQFAEFRLLVCGKCGLTRFYADAAALKKLVNSGHWVRHVESSTAPNPVA